MTSQVSVLVINNMRAFIRDRVLYAVLGVAGTLILLVPAMSSFSMRQVQELAITLSLSISSLILLVVTLLLGASSVWRDIERRYTTSILTLPMSRGAYLLSKFISIALFLTLCTAVLGLSCILVITLASSSYPSELPIHWGNICLALIGNLLKYLVLVTFAILISTVSTSFYLPFFTTIAIYFCGSASQEVFEYVTGQLGQEISPVVINAITLVYYCLPNLSAFDFQVHAVYGLTVSIPGLLLSTLYALIYIGILLGLAIYAFSRRELP